MVKRFIKPTVISPEEAWEMIQSRLPVESARLDLQVVTMSFQNALSIINGINQLEEEIERLESKLAVDNDINAEIMDEKRREMAREIREGERDTARERGEVERD